QLGVADHAQHALLGVLDATVVVDDRAGARVVVHGVDGEVAAGGVLVLGAPDVVAQHAAAGVHDVRLVGQLLLGSLLIALDLLGGVGIQVGAEGRDLDHFVFATAAVDHVHDAKTPPDDEGAAKQGFDLLGRGVGGHIEILGAQAQQQVAHGAADDVGLEAGILQGLDHLAGALVHQVGIDAVPAGRHVDALAGGDARGGTLARACAGSAEIGRA